VTTTSAVPGPFRRWQLWLAGAGIATMLGLLSFTYQYLDVFVRARSEPYHEKLIEELTGAWGACLLAIPVVMLTRHLAGRGVRGIPAHIGGLLAYSIAHTLLNWGTRILAYIALGMGEYDYGIMWIRFFMEFPNDIFLYAIIVSFTLIFGRYRASKENEVRVAELEVEMSRVRLQALEARLHPHFLFNALNTVSAVMYESVEDADRMLTRLGELLRRTLRNEAGTEVPLAEEVETLELYLDVVRARFGDRLSVSVDVSDDARQAAVPSLLLQPLVENALKHGDPGPGIPATVAVSAARSNGTVAIAVRDNGPGLRRSPDEALTSGIGLSTTQRRLERLYGRASNLSLANEKGGGLTVRVVLPYREAAIAEPQ
jgi:signal transduction histidine kinase